MLLLRKQLKGTRARCDATTVWTGGDDDGANETSLTSSFFLVRMKRNEVSGRFSRDDDDDVGFNTRMAREWNDGRKTDGCARA